MKSAPILVRDHPRRQSGMASMAVARAWCGGSITNKGKRVCFSPSMRDDLNRPRILCRVKSRSEDPPEAFTRRLPDVVMRT